MFILFIGCIKNLLLCMVYLKKKLTSNHTLSLKQFSYLSKIGGRGNNSFEKRPKTPFLDKMFGGKIIVYGSCKKWWHLRWRNIMSSLPTHLLYISITVFVFIKLYIFLCRLRCCESLEPSWFAIICLHKLFICVV